MDWKPFKTTPNKIQFINAGYGNAFDTSFCVTFSILKCLQTIFNQMISLGLIPQAYLDWLKLNNYLNNLGQLDFSPRFTGTMADTTIYGNSQWNVMNAIIAYGLIPEKTYPNQANSWTEYADETKITQEMKDLGQEFLKRFLLDSKEESYFSALDKSPLDGIVRFADGNGILSPVGPTNHGIMVENDGDDLTYVNISDSYWQEEKKYDRNKVSFLKSFIITPKTMTPEQIAAFIKNNDLKWVRNKDNGSFGRIMQGQLKTFTTNDRAVDCLLDDAVRKNGIQISNVEWLALPKVAF